MKILVIEDDQTLLDYISKSFREVGYLVDSCSNGKDGLYQSVTEHYDLIILDRMLPNVDGMTILRTLRASSNKTLILILSALGELDQRVEGLSLGADDYLKKPFAFEELKARVEALLRRSRGDHSQDLNELVVDNIRLDLKKRKAWAGEEPILLQHREFLLLEYLMRNAGQLVSRTMLLENVWEYRFDPQTNVIDVHISRLRKKIDCNRSRSLVTTVRGSGYVFG